MAREPTFRGRWGALRAIRENYTRRGVLIVLRAPVPEYVRINHDPKQRHTRVWRLLLRDPEAVIAWQVGLAEGVFI